MHPYLLWNITFVKKVLVNDHVTQAFYQTLQTTKLNFDANKFFFFFLKIIEIFLNLQILPPVPTFVLAVLVTGLSGYFVSLYLVAFFTV